MKKLTSLIAVIALGAGIAVVGCSSSGDDNSTTPSGGAGGTAGASGGAAGKAGAASGGAAGKAGATSGGTGGSGTAGTLTVNGGLTESGESVRRVDVFDMATGRWSAGPEFPGTDRIGFSPGRE